MTAPKNALPVNFDQFRKNPVAANAKIEALDVKIDKLSYALKKSDSCLASAMTEIRIMQTMKKL